MKKLLFSFALLTLSLTASRAQLSIGGLPLSMQANQPSDYIPVTKAPLPDWETALQQWNAQPEPKPALIAVMTSIDLSFPNSGILYNAPDGSRIWKAQFKMDGAKALGLYYDHFYLPQGVKLFLSNKNNKQILGAYTTSNNNPSGKFATEAVEGSVITLELNIPSDVDLNDIQLHINRADSYFAGIEHLIPYRELQTLDGFDSQLAGLSSVCMINAMCPLGRNYPIQRDASVQVLLPVNGGTVTCTGTMINTAANTPNNCKQYLLFASHCNGSNSTEDNGFSQVILHYNFLYNTCNPDPNTVLNTQNTITGAKFVARSVFPGAATQVKGDFLLLELNNPLPDSWGIKLAGWNNASDIPLTNNDPEKFISFHHPGGDVKKVSTAHNIESYNIATPGSHWKMQLDSGLASVGSSGCALFDGNGRIIGIASVGITGQGISDECSQNSRGQNVRTQSAASIIYSKFSYNWNNPGDADENIRKLKPWLDPNNTGVTTINAANSNCENATVTGITNIPGKLDQAITVFPNPSTNGQITLQINLLEPTDLRFELYDVSGKRVMNTLKRIRSGAFNFDMSRFANGMYLLKIDDGVNRSSKKIMLSK